MLGFLKNHPFAVRAEFEYSLVLTFAAPVEQLSAHLPPGLAADTLDGQWGFAAVAMVRTRALRPAGWPRCLGSDFFLIGTRIFVRHTGSDGRARRGLYIVKSETDRRKMQWLGNLFTQYRYTTTDIRADWNGSRLRVDAKATGLHVEVETGIKNPPLPAGSPFENWRAARRFAGPLPFTFSWQADKNRMLVIEGVRQNWTPAPVSVRRCEIPWLETLHCAGLVLANAFLIRNIPYYWKKGRFESCSSPT